MDRSPQAPPSTGSSRQEYWSGLPFPSLKDLLNPRNEPASPALAGRFFTTEPQERPLQYLKVKGAQFCPTLCDSMDYIVYETLQIRILEWVAFPSPGDLPNPGIEPRSPTLRVDSLPAEPQGKPKNTGVGSLSLLQRIFPTQESNRGLLHCRRILYQLSCEGSLSPSEQVKIWCRMVGRAV